MPMAGRFTGKKAVVTGASRGIGRSVALSLAREGASVAVVSRGVDDLETLRKEISSAGAESVAVTADMTERASVRKAIEEIDRAFGKPDIIVHNAGGSLQVTDPRADYESWERVWYFNVGSGIELNNAFIEHMIRSGWGRIVHVASASVITYGGHSPYVSAKCALVGYVKSAARAMARHGVVMSAVAPGPVNVPGRYLPKIAAEDGAEWKTYCDNHLAARRLAEPDEVAGVIQYLCSDEAGFAVGSLWNLDGGTS